MVKYQRKKVVILKKSVNCQIITILLTPDNEFSNKYTSITSNCLDYDDIIEDYFRDKQMQNIKIDLSNQSLCFTNQKNLIEIYNPETKKDEQYYEEVHIHCNGLKDFDDFVEYLYSNYQSIVNEVNSLPHYNAITNNNLKNCELLMEPMVNEVTMTKNLVKILSQKNEELIFRAISIHFAKLIDNINDIDSELIHKLNNIYQKNVINNSNQTLFFSEEISNKLLNIYNEENNYQNNINKIPSNNFNIENEHNLVYQLDSENYNNIF